MGIIGNAIKNNIGSYDKYKQDQEKVAQVLDIDKAKNICTISIINRDGIPETVYEVPIKKSYEGIVQWRPAAGEFVEVTEINKRLTIVDKFENNTKSDNREIQNDLFSSLLNGNIGGYSGMM